MGESGGESRKYWCQDFNKARMYIKEMLIYNMGTANGYILLRGWVDVN